MSHCSTVKVREVWEDVSVTLNTVLKWMFVSVFCSVEEQDMRNWSRHGSHLILPQQCSAGRKLHISSTAALEILRSAIFSIYFYLPKSNNNAAASAVGAGRGSRLLSVWTKKKANVISQVTPFAQLLFLWPIFVLSLSADARDDSWHNLWQPARVRCFLNCRRLAFCANWWYTMYVGKV